MPRKTTTPATYPTARISTVKMPLMEAAALIGGTWGSGLLGEPAELQASRDIAQKLMVHADRAGVADFADLAGPVARQIVAAAAGVPKLGATLTDEQKTDVRLIRNIFVAMHATVALAAPPELRRESLVDLPRSPFARDANESCRYPRPWTAEEILLARIHFWTDDRPSSLRPGIAYALVEAGATPRDASAALDTDLIDDDGNPELRTPTTVKVNARAYRGYRELKLTSFGAALMARNLRLMEHYEVAGRDRLTFTGAKPGSANAGMSVQLYLNKHTAWAGVDDNTTNVSGLALWRHLQLLNQHGLDAATDCAYGGAGQFTPGQRGRKMDYLLEKLFLDQNEARKSIPWPAQRPQRDAAAAGNPA